MNLYGFSQTDMLSLITCLQKCSNSWGHSESRYALDGGAERGYSKNVQKRTRGGELPRVYVSLYLFKGAFSHLNCLFLFFTALMGK